MDELIESAGARVLRLPPYSPDFNPIEMAISKIKSILRKLARRTVDSLLTAIDQAVAAVTADDALAFTRGGRGKLNTYFINPSPLPKPDPIERKARKTCAGAMDFEPDQSANSRARGKVSGSDEQLNSRADAVDPSQTLAPAGVNSRAGARHYQ